MDSIYDILMTLPLFQGISRVLLLELIEKTPFHFEKFQDGETIIEAGEPCTNMRFIVSGEARVDIPFNNKKIHILETLEAPNVIGPDCLFGLHPSYPYSVKAYGNCGTLQIKKTDYIKMIKSDEVFLFNILNVLSRNSQSLNKNFLALNRGTVAEKLAFLITSLTHNGCKDVSVVFRRKDICTMLGVKRTTFFSALEALKAEEIIDFSLSEIDVLNLDALESVLKPNDILEIAALKAKNL